MLPLHAPGPRACPAGCSTPLPPLPSARRFYFPNSHSLSASKLYYSYDVAGAHIIMLGSYVGGCWQLYCDSKVKHSAVPMRYGGAASEMLDSCGQVTCSAHCSGCPTSGATGMLGGATVSAQPR